MTERAETGRQRIVSSGTAEASFGYSRAVRVGQFVFVSGTTATGPNGELLGGNDPEKQAVAAIEKIGRALAEAGATFADVVRTRVYVVNADDADAVGRAHVRFFGAIRPANTLFEVSRLVGSEYLVEIEADAIIGSGVPG